MYLIIIFKSIFLVFFRLTNFYFLKTFSKINGTHLLCEDETVAVVKFVGEKRYGTHLRKWASTSAASVAALEGSRLNRHRRLGVHLLT